jgi:hypothetical protein
LDVVVVGMGVAATEVINLTVVVVPQDIMRQLVDLYFIACACAPRARFTGNHNVGYIQGYMARYIWIALAAKRRVLCLTSISLLFQDPWQDSVMFVPCIRDTSHAPSFSSDKLG